MSPVEHLSRLVDPGDPDRVLDEVLRMTDGILAPEERERLASVDRDVRRLFAGDWPGYAACDTRYHDLEHTTDTFLAMARLVHGAFLRPSPVLDGATAFVGLVGALLHDTGYIRRRDDRSGTGARFTRTHISRSVAFAREYLPSRGFPPGDVELCGKVLLCTGLETAIPSVDFRSEAEGAAGRMLGTADIVGQMASRRYPGKLPHLFREFVEAGLADGTGEAAFLAATPSFYRAVCERLDGELGGVHRFLRDHFRAWVGVDRDLCREAIEENVRFVRQVVLSSPEGYRERLARGAAGAIPPGAVPLPA